MNEETQAFIDAVVVRVYKACPRGFDEPAVTDEGSWSIVWSSPVRGAITELLNAALDDTLPDYPRFLEDHALPGPLGRTLMREVTQALETEMEARGGIVLVV